MLDGGDRRVADYFVHCGLPAEQELHELNTPLEDFSVKPSHNYAPITDVTVVFAADEPVPSGYKCIEKTPTGLSADLNHGSLRSKEVYLCYKRGWDKPPLVDVGVLYDGREYVMPDSQVVEFTPSGRVANVNNSSARTYVTYRRAEASAPCNELVVTDICVIVLTKDEVPPHTYCIIPKTLNKGMVGSDVYICYKKSMRQPTRIIYKPGLLSRYPVEERSSFPLPPSVPLFCLPMGATVELWPSPASTPPPVFSTFVFTVADGAEKVYGSAITFYERQSPCRLSDQQRLQLGVDSHHPSEISINVNCSLCVLSHWPFFDTFAQFLLFLHELSVSGRAVNVPLERYISHFLLEVPFPSVSRPCVHVQLDSGGESDITLSQPHVSPLPRSGASYCELLRNMGPDNCLLLLVYTLTEQKLLLHSLRPDTLTRVAETVHSMIFPFQWQCPYIPLCPLGLADILSAPVPFLVGLDSRYFDVYDPPPDVTCVDLDTNTVFVSEDKRQLSVKLLPKKPAKTLRTALDNIYHKLLSLLTRNKQSGSKSSADFVRMKLHLELEIQEAFLRFMMSILRGYRSFLKPIKTRPRQGTTDSSSLFNMEGFLKSRDKTHQHFYQLVMSTQTFIRFIEERSFVTEKDTYLVFFDECLEKDMSSPDSRLLELDSGRQCEMTVFVPPPEPLDNTQFQYKEFGRLDSGLFLPWPSSRVAVDGGSSVDAPAPVCQSSDVQQQQPCVVTSQCQAPPQSASSLLVPVASSVPTTVSCSSASGVFASPMLRRSKHELMSARRLAHRRVEHPALWASHLISTCFSLWFVHLPSYVEASGDARAVMDQAFQLLRSMQKIVRNNADEVCYRVMMQLCGQWSQPVLAVKVLDKMKRCGLQPNALTYGYYNRAVLESQWPLEYSPHGRVLWSRLRNVLKASCEFRAAQRRCERRRVLRNDDTAASSTLSIADCESMSSVSVRGSVRSLNRNNTRVGEVVGESLLSARVHGRSCHVPVTSSCVMAYSGGGSEGRIVDSCAVHLASCQCDPASCRSHGSSALMLHSVAGLLMSSVGVESRVGHVTCVDGQVSDPRRPGVSDRGCDSQLGSCSPRCLSTSGTVEERGGTRECHENETVNIDDKCGALPDVFLSASSSSSSSLCSCDEPSSRRLVMVGQETAGSGGSSSLVRTPVTSNDPLGVFNGSLTEPALRQHQSSTTGSSITAAASLIKIRRSLFERELFSDRTDSVTSSQSTSAVADSALASLGREHVSVASSARRTSTGTATPGLKSSSQDSLRLPFSRLERASSLAGEHLKSVERKFRSRLINTSDLDTIVKNYSGGGLKSQELMKSGVKSLRSAASSVCRRLDQLKEVVSSQSHVLNKAASLTSVDGDHVIPTTDSVLSSRAGDSVAGGVSGGGSGLNQTDTQSDQPQTLADYTQLFNSKCMLNTLLPGGGASPSSSWWWDGEREGGVAVRLLLCSCCQCSHCHNTLYDEHIMAGWGAEDSNLNCRCPFCRRSFVPVLSVNITDYRNKSRQFRLNELNSGQPHCDARVMAPVRVPYLSPLVLRKELENLLEHDGADCLAHAGLVHQHPIIYWNLVWYFSRINAPTHLTGLYLHSTTTTTTLNGCSVDADHNADDSWSRADWRHVLVCCVWHLNCVDNNDQLCERLCSRQRVGACLQDHVPVSPLVDSLLSDYCPPRVCCVYVLSCIQYNRLDLAVDYLASKLANNRPSALLCCHGDNEARVTFSCRKCRQQMSLYWRLLFLTISAFGAQNVDLVSFDRQFMRVLESREGVTARASSWLGPVPRLAQLHCRHIFSPLQLPVLHSSTSP